MGFFTAISPAALIAELAAGQVIANTVVTHDGPRHADEVMAVAWLAATSPHDIRVCMTRHQEVLKAEHPRLTFVDVGGVYDPARRRFDHHFVGAPARPDGIKFSSFGLVVDQELKEESLVRHVDALDNGQKADAPAWWPKLDATDPNGGSVAWAVNRANPVHMGGEPIGDAEFEERALELINLFVGLFNWDGTVIEDDRLATWLAGARCSFGAWHDQAEAARAASVVRVKRAFQAAQEQAAWESGENNPDYTQIPVLVLDQYESAALDWLSRVPGTLYLVFPGPGNRQWMVQQVAQSPGSFAGRKPLPAAWAGLRDGAFAEATGVADAVFCHPGRFICGAKTCGGAEALAKLALAA